MSDDLISRKALLEEIRSFRCSITGLRAGKGVLASAVDEYRKSILQIIEDQPTAFDKEKVINEIRSGVMAANDEYIETCDEYYHGMQEAHKNDWKIVEKGGIE